MKFHVADSLTGKIVGRLEPTSWEFTDPLRAPGIGALTVPLPEPDQVDRLRELTWPRRRWVAFEDAQGRILFGGPILRHPYRVDGTVTIPLVDWRAWFYRAPIRPNTDGTRRNYIKVGAGAIDQGQMMADLLTLGLDTIGAPKMVIDTAPVTGVTRELTALMLDRSIGEYLDSVMNRERGSEWFTRVTWDAADATRLVVHCAVAYPERQTRSGPIRVEYREGSSGNAFDHTWPEGSESPTRVWAIGDGEPPDQAVAKAETAGLLDGTDVCWEETVGPLDGVIKNATAFEHAYANLARGQGLSGTAEFAVTDAEIPIGDYAVGDRARVILDSRWDVADVPAARIVERTVSGGRGAPTSSRIKVDLADLVYPTLGTTPGEAVTT